MTPPTRKALFRATCYGRGISMAHAATHVFDVSYNHLLCVLAPTADRLHRTPSIALAKKIAVFVGQPAQLLFPEREFPSEE